VWVSFLKPLEIMEEMLILMAAMLPKEKLMADLKEAIISYETDPSAENEDKVIFQCMLIMTKKRLGKSSASDTIKDFKETKEALSIGRRITGKDTTS
jgi:hypothetical protein